MIIIIQNGYKCDYEMNLFASMFFSENEDVTVMQNFTYKNDSTKHIYTIYNRVFKTSNLQINNNSVY